MASTITEYAHLPKVERSEVQLLWHSSFWDSPKSGLCLYQGRKVWFEMGAEADEDGTDGYYRRFLLLELSSEQLADEEYWHELFRQKVGTNCDHGEPAPGLRPREMWREFYEPYQKRERTDYTRNRALGWFEQ